MKQSFVVLCLLLASVFASAQTPDCAALTHQALELSGFNDSLSQINELMSSDDFMRQIQGGSSSDEVVARIRPILQKDLNGDTMRKELQAKLVVHCNPEQVKQAVDRLQTPFVARMLALEAASNTPEGKEKLKRYIKIAQTSPPNDDLMDALNAVDQASGSTDFAADMVIAVLHGMMSGVGAPSDMVEQVRQHRKEVKDQMQNAIELSLSATYHGVTRADLQQYAKELSAPALKGFYDQVKKAFLEVTEEHSKAVGEDLKAVLGAGKS